MSDPGGEQRTGWRRWCNTSMLGVALLVAAIAVSLTRVLVIRDKLFATDKVIIRVAHWQLEMGFRDALQAVIDRYNELHAKDNVMVVQMAVTEKVYKQWLNVHLISGTAPDLSEVGMSKYSNDARYVTRYYVPITEFVSSPNPYNKGTPLEDVPWRETFIDGMRGGYRDDLQDYFFTPTIFGSVRIFYNTRMLEEATGTNAPPRTLGGLFNACAALREYGRAKGRELIPIAGSKYSRTFFVDKYRIPFTAWYESVLDADLDGTISTLDTLAGFLRGAVSFNDPPVRAWYECVKAICDEFSKGFMAMERDQAAFLFVQGKAAMIASGSWDAESLFRQASFQVGVMDFPLPGPGERWHNEVKGRVNEATSNTGGGLGLYKYSAHKEWALDFCRFLTSLAHNELFSQTANWLPVIAGAKPTPQLEPFMPNPVGYSTGLEYKDGGRVRTFMEGQLWRYLQDEITYDEFARLVMREIRDARFGAERVWADEYENAVRASRETDRLLAVQTTLALMAPPDPDLPGKYRRLLLQQVGGNNGEGLRYRFEQQEGRPLPTF